MAWCPHCAQDRPIQRQTFAGQCTYCNALAAVAHKPGCRGPVAGALDVCTYCNTPVFARVADQASYEQAEAQEAPLRQQSTGCVVFFLILGGAIAATVSLIV